MYQIQKTVCDHISQHWEECWKYDTQQSISDKLQGLRIFWSDTVFSVWYIFSIKTKTKMGNKIVDIYANKDHIFKHFQGHDFLHFNLMNC